MAKNFCFFISKLSAFSLVSASGFFGSFDLQEICAENVFCFSTSFSLCFHFFR